MKVFIQADRISIEVTSDDEKTTLFSWGAEQYSVSLDTQALIKEVGTIARLITEVGAAIREEVPKFQSRGEQHGHE